ncbi:unnamed protein product [Bursaphelenchus okinawaensis]|uniref:DUF1248 domain-containing protein n=1 Tax=Bursaphelenchus okinawaensis TaxID=465554 RepID=A0A811LN04_9BILA|nr:unnamed protein product [Bursaphelenchus okinawaensis]CAG9127148.1 unnamed protein product [Bursaphelenchus okinawaensis]
MTENVELLINPSNDYWQQLCKLIVEEEDWLNALHDYETWRSAFGDDFKLIVAVDKETKALIGSISVTQYHGQDDLSIIGCFFVTKQNRGKGVGQFLFEEAKKQCTNHKFLFGAASMTKKYAEVHQFDKLPDYAVIRRTIVINRLRPLLLNNDPTLILKHPAAVGWDHIAKYLQKYSRTLQTIHCVKALMTQPGAHPLVALTTEDRIVAIGVVKEQYNQTLSVGPLLGNDPIATSTVLRGILLNIDNLMDFKKFVMESPTNNEESDKMIRQLSEGHYEAHFGHELQPQFTDSVVSLPDAHIYGIGQSDVSLI